MYIKVVNFRFLLLLVLMALSVQAQAQLFNQAKFPFVLRAPGNNSNQAGSFHSEGSDFVTVTNISYSGNLYYDNDTVNACAAMVVLDSAFNVKKTASFTIDSVIGLGNGSVNASFGSNYGRNPTYSNGYAHFFVWPDSTKQGIMINGVPYTRPAIGRQRAYIAMDTAGVIQTVDYFNFSPGNDYNMPAPFHVYHGDNQFVALDFIDTLSITGQPQIFTANTSTSIVIARNRAGQVLWDYKAPAPAGYVTLIYDLRAIDGGNVVLFHRHSITGGAMTYFLTEINGTTGAEVWKDTMSTLILPKTKKINGEHYLIGQVSATSNSFRIGNAVVTASNGLHDFVAKRNANGNWQVLFSQPHVLQFDDFHIEPDGSIVLVGAVIGNTNSGTTTITKFFGNMGKTVTGASDGFIARLSPNFVPNLFEVYGGTQRYTSFFGFGTPHNEAIGGIIKRNGRFYILGNFSIDIALGGFALYENSLPAGNTTIASSPFLASFTLNSFDKDTIVGKIFYDVNENTVQDAGETGISGIVVKVLPNKFAMTDVNGVFRFLVDPGTYRLTVPNSGYFISTPDTTTVTFANAGLMDTTARFAFAFPDTIVDLSVTVTGSNLLRTNGIVQIRYDNRGNVAQGGQVVYIRPEKFTVSSTNPPPTVTNGDTLIWDFNNLDPLQHSNIVILGSPPAPIASWLGTNVFHMVYIAPGVADSNVVDNYDTLVQTIAGSYDPNNKVALPASGLSQPEVLDREYIDYTVNFQNTGNDTAFLVVISDTLDHTMLDIASLEVVGATHPFETILTEQGNLAFRFNNILLPDSTTDAINSQGAVYFRIKPLPHLLAGDTIRNRAFIYFDGNAPIITNTAVTPITAQVSISSVSSDVCVNDSINVSYVTSGLFGTGNSFEFVLSNEFGSFNNPTSLATVSGNTGGSVTLAIPAGPESDNYSLRIVATSAPVVSTPFIGTVNLHALPMVSIADLDILLDQSGATIGLPNHQPAGGTFSGPFANAFDLSDSLAIVVSPADSGSYELYYTYADQEGCVATDTAIITLRFAVGMDDVLGGHNFILYPNPANDVITVESEYQFAEFFIYDISGKKQLAHTLATTSTTINISKLSGGMYFYNLVDAEGVTQYAGKLIKQ